MDKNGMVFGKFLASAGRWGWLVKNVSHSGPFQTKENLPMAPKVTV